MKLSNILLTLILCFSSLAYSQSSIDSVVITPGDTASLSINLPPLSKYPKPLIYDKWFAKIAKCEGLTLPPKEELDKIQYVLVNSDGFYSDTTGVLYDAEMLNKHHVMVVSLPYVYKYDVIGHEILHFILWYTYGDKYQSPNTIHPPEYFGHCNIRAG